ncbi:hypothetical protein VTJ04DRAFT_9303 [Mycothermus thermophilus]|uniref:uncharacterized protein n=1 Tax=Humicola insolens TaxID=85995 RepID=UPI00374398B2
MAMDAEHVNASASSSASEPDEEPVVVLPDGYGDGDSDNSSDDTDLEPVLAPSSDEVSEDEKPDVVKVAARAYQLEMLEESLKQNIIVAMDTGSGKTQVAILRIQVEMERTDKIAWFLVPTVALVDQQFAVIQAQIPSVRSLAIHGSDNVDAWSSQPGIWDAVLLNTRIVVSTYQILLDAVNHALVSLESLCLIVIDEAHNCTRNHPCARLMREHYAPRKAQGLPVPHILGLTASPLMRNNLAGIDILEKTLDAVVKTPSRHREELLAHVNRPEMKTVTYPPRKDDYDLPPALGELRRLYLGIDITQDPYVVYLRQRNTVQHQRKLKEAFMKRKTFCLSTLSSLARRATEMLDNLGPWAAEYYLHAVISGFLHGDVVSQEPGDFLREKEWRFLADILRQVPLPRPPPTPTSVSPKVDALINILSTHPGDPKGIIFVKERATATVLSHILSAHPRTAARYRVGTMVGTSNVPGRSQSFLDLSSKDYLLSLHAFRTGKTNLVVATSVLEEGIDVPACNLVVCFDEPQNLKAFIQRRGRARMSDSALYLLVQEDEEDAEEGAKKKNSRVRRDWLHMEKLMKQKYEDEMRENPLLAAVEASDAKLEAVNDYPILRDPETGAKLTIHDAKAHLEHFCATLRARKFVDWTPVYIVHDLEGNPILDPYAEGLRRATVHLPISLPPELRKFQGLHAWRSDNAAYRDAAFQAYQALYRAGLVNKNLLPVTEDDLIGDKIEKREGTVVVREQMDPWIMVAKEWEEGGGARYKRRMTVESPDGKKRLVTEVVMPVPVPYMEPLNLHWEHGAPPWRVIMDMEEVVTTGDDEEEKDRSLELLKLAFGHRRNLDTEKRYPVKFVLVDDGGGANNLHLTATSTPVSEEVLSKFVTTHLVRHVDKRNTPYFPVAWLSNKPPLEMVAKVEPEDYDERPDDTAYVVVRRWPKAIPLFHPGSGTQALVTKRYPRIIPADQLVVDNIPAIYARVGFLIPVITHALGVHLVARDLLETRLQETGITDISLVISAITARAARSWTDYERLEFLGDSILKFCTTVNCCAKHLKHHEGILSPLKDKLVSNSRLCRAAIAAGLDVYLIYQQFQLRRWRPTYLEDLLFPRAATATRVLSTKTLADLIESLLGAAYVSHGTAGALACISRFLPNFSWQDVAQCQRVLFDSAPADELLPQNLRPVEPLLGHTFAKKALLVEALTHPSCSGPGIRASLDRLEFLGDAVLDFLVVKKLVAYADPEPLETQTLHLLRTALVNADILGFLVMEWCATIEGNEVETVCRASTSTSTSTDNPKQDDDEPASPSSPSSSSESVEIKIHKTTTSFPLYTFLRHSSPEMSAVQRLTARRHAALREKILHALWHGKKYPWTLLAQLRVHKFYSDVLESILGAVWVDCASSSSSETESNDDDDDAAVAACEALLERVGILPLMRRLVRDRVELLHPKEMLGRLAGGESVKFEVAEVQAQGEEGGEREDGEKVVFACKVLVGGECLAAVDGAGSRLEARTRAAERACEVLMVRKGKVDRGWGVEAVCTTS